MKKALIGIAAVALLAGCTSTDIEGPGGWRMRRRALHPFRRMDIGNISVSSNGTMSVEGYDNRADPRNLTTMIDTAVKAAVQAVKP